MTISTFRRPAAAAAATVLASTGFASEAQIQIPDLRTVTFELPGGSVSGPRILYAGIGVCALGLLFGLWQYRQTRRLAVHPAMAGVSDIIW